MRFHLAIVFGVLLLLPCTAQVSHSTDSIVVERNHISFERLIHAEPLTAFQHLDTLEKFASSAYPRSQFLYQYDLGYSLFTTGRNDSAMVYFRKSYDYAIENQMELERVYSQIWIANLLYFRNQRDTARTLYTDIINRSSQIGYVDGIANGYFGMISISDDEEKVLKYHLKIDSVYKRHDTISPILANSLTALGRIYLKSNYIERARDYFNRSLEISRETNYVPGIVFINDLLGDIERNQGNFDRAESYYRQALKESEKKGDTLFVAHGLIQLSHLDVDRSRYKAAEEKTLKAYKTFVRLNEQGSITGTEILLSKIYVELGQHELAKVYMDKAKINPVYISEDDYLKDLYEVSIAYNESTNNFQVAFEFQKKLDSLTLAITEKRNNEAFIELERKIAAEQSQREIDLLNTEKELIEQKRINQRNLLIGGLGLTSLIGIFLFYLFRNRQRTAQKLKEVDRLKSNFFANISHEFRTPLTLISGPVEKRLESKKIGKKERVEFELIQQNSNRLLSLVDQLLDLSKLESGKYQLRVSKGNLGTLIKVIAESFQFPAKEKKIQYEIKVEKADNVWFDSDVIQKIVTNLLSNAIKYTPEKGFVKMGLKSEHGRAFFRLQNSPTSLEPTSVVKLFDRFYQDDQHSEGVGIGLSLVKELTELMYGNVEVSRPEADSLEFCVEFPTEKKAFKEGDFYAANTFQQNGKFNIHKEVHSEKEESSKQMESDSSGNDILLIVEDNAEVRKLIKNSFSGPYEVIEAKNGQEGIEQALAHIPDLIISDVMMPEVDGLQLLDKLKNDELTSHIPIILLTAKAGEEDQYKGLSTGADAYVTKPFTFKLLEARVSKLIESRKKLRDRYSQEVILKPKDIAITNLDEHFLERVQEVLDLRLTESDFNAQEFSEAVGMSRMQLHRKLKALTGLSTTEFVRSQRLKLAASLLENSDANVSQIGYQVGFNDHPYFTRCFKELYGVSPSEYSKKNSE